MEFSSSLGAIAAALAKAQSEEPKIQSKASLARQEKLSKIAIDLCSAQLSKNTELESKGVVLASRFFKKSWSKNAMTPTQRFFDKVGFGMSECWFWYGFINEQGYGGTGKESAHRHSWKLFRGEIPDGMVVCHKCDIRNCVNPDHLFLGTQKDNVRDAMDKKRFRAGHGIGLNSKLCKVNREKIIQIRDLYSTGNYFQKEIAKKYRISVSLVEGILSGRKWGSII